MGIRILDDYLLYGDPQRPPRGARQRRAVSLEGRTGLSVGSYGRVRAVADCADPRGGADVGWLRWMAQVDAGLFPLG